MSEAASEGLARPGLVEIGWVIVEPLPAVDREAIRLARARVQAHLEQTLPSYEWKMPELAHRRDDRSARVESVDLVDEASIEREAKHWDFAVVVTNAELTSHTKPYALGVTARSVAVAVLSTLRIDPEPLRETADEGKRTEVIARRLEALFLIAFARLNGVDLGDPTHPSALDERTELDESDCADLDRALHEVADVRVEETGGARPGRFGFYVRAVRSNLRAMLGVVLQAKPWQFPWRLSRLTGAALSALVVLIVTGEVWDLAMSRPLLEIVVLSLGTLTGTTVFVLHRQQLLIRQTGRLMEQTAIANVAAAIIVACGMTATYLLLFVTTFAMGEIFFAEPLVLRWAASLDGSITTSDYVVLAGFIASLGIVIGALGASFEEQGYFRHVARIDHEI